MENLRLHQPIIAGILSLLVWIIATVLRQAFRRPAAGRGKSASKLDEFTRIDVDLNLGTNRRRRRIGAVEGVKRHGLPCNIGLDPDHRTHEFHGKNGRIQRQITPVGRAEVDGLGAQGQGDGLPIGGSQTTAKLCNRGPDPHCAHARIFDLGF